MNRKGFNILIFSLLGMILLGLLSFVVYDCVATSCKVDKIAEETSRARGALAVARMQARKIVREKLRQDVKKVEKEDVEKARKSQAAAKERRGKVRHFFASRGFETSSSYMRAIAMPDEKPSSEDQEVIDLAGEAASDVDLDTAADVLELSIASKDPRVRLSAVEMLSGLGEAGLLDLSEFLADPHPDVANLAADRWELGIQNLMDEKEQVSLVKVGFLAITDEDQLRSLGGTLMLVSDAKLAVDALSDVIRDGTSVQCAAAREAYEGVTGEKWIDEEAAKVWLEENYVPPEPDEGEFEDEKVEDEDLAETTQIQENEDESE